MVVVVYVKTRTLTTVPVAAHNKYFLRLSSQFNLTELNSYITTYYFIILVQVGGDISVLPT